MRTGNKKGYVLLTVVCVFAFLSALGFTLLTAALANMQSAERKLASAQTDAYAVSLAESVNGMVEAGRFEPLVSGWKQAAAASASIPDGRDSVFLPGRGAANALESEEIAVADPADPGADGPDGPYGRLLLPFGRHRPPGPRRPGQPQQIYRLRNARGRSGRHLPA